MYSQYISPFGYKISSDGIDSYGVNHQGFDIRDEIEYQFAREKRENELMAQYKLLGITDNFPQYGTNFWSTTDNNYGFGISNIADNIANMKHITTPIPTAVFQAQTQKLFNEPNCYIEFDGGNVDLYKFGQYDGNRLQNGQLQSNLEGQSGDNYHQSSIYQNVANKGPIPEGVYYANQDQRQSLTFNSLVLKLVEKLGINTNQKSNWSGFPTAWGINRVWLQPDVNTNTYGRTGFSIHGGWNKGSAGCIDIPWQTQKLSDYLDNCQNSVPVYVKYPNK